MSKFCVACFNEKNGIKTILSHTCGKTNIVFVGGRNAGKNIELDKLLKSVEITQKIKRCHETVVALHKSEYKQVLKPVMDSLQLLMAEKKCSEVNACLQLCQKYKEENPTAVVLILAATFELMINKVDHE